MIDREKEVLYELLVKKLPHTTAKICLDILEPHIQIVSPFKQAEENQFSDPEMTDAFALLNELGADKRGDYGNPQDLMQAYQIVLLRDIRTMLIEQYVTTKNKA